ncbi:hypothetical protein [Eikenella halliae]|uniref:hypothetical protein n=1 Tax=Eikenella halliae TaxID=1795832 RepID=UPI00361906B6
MKIISKFKDFYDHKVAKYGIDPVLVFDRRQSPDADIPHGLPEPPAGWEKEYGACAAMSALYVGRLRVYLFNMGAHVYTSFDVAEVIRRPSHPGRDIYPQIRFHDGGEYCLPQYGDYLLSANEKFQAETVASREELPTAPLLLECETGLRSWQEGRFAYYANPQLSALGIYIDPDIVWQHLFAYLSQLKNEAETSPSVPDQDNIGNKGFDAKHSFRPKMKRK